MATTIGSYQSWASSVPVPTSKGYWCLRDQCPNQVNNHIHVGLSKLRLQQVVPLDEIEAGDNPPPTKVEKPPPLIEVGSLPPQVEAGNQPPQGVQLNCPQG